MASRLHDHIVQFYDSDEFLARAVRDHVIPALDGDGAAIVVATPAHRDALTTELSSANVDLEGFISSGRYIALDAEETLSRFMVDGSPDPALFEDTIGGLVSEASAGGRSVKVFGEMVAILWAQGNVTAAIQLEELWNDLAETRTFSLFCAYPMDYFTNAASTAGFERVCTTHSHVLPTEDYLATTSEDERLRAIAISQQMLRAERHESETLRLKQQELEEALERVEELDRTRREFVAMVVHDIRSPTAVVSGFLEMLRDNWEAFPEDQIRELLTKGIDNTQQITRLADDVLTVALIDSGQFGFDMKPFDLNEVIYKAVGATRASTPSHRIEVELPSALPPAFGDEGRHLQILSNLLSNAIKFSPPGTTVQVSAVQDDEEIVVSVRDQGDGITREDLPKLFRRFSRLEVRRTHGVKGTGLGLFICKSLVEGQNGRIWVDSERGEGATFSYTVPTALSRRA